AQFRAANLPAPSIAHGAAYLPVGAVPLFANSGNVAFADYAGLQVWHNLQGADPSLRSVVQDFTAWRNTNLGVRVYFSSDVTIHNVSVCNSSWGILSDNNSGLVYDHVNVQKCGTGIYAPGDGTNVIQASYLNNLTNIYDKVLPGHAQTLVVAPDVTFG